jgi:hypothetical protein
MTRINIGIEPYELCDQMLLAEYRELPRVRTLAINRINKNIPNRFTLGKGHVLYFLDKGRYLKYRWEMLCNEMRYRNFNVMMSWREYPEKYSVIDISNEVLNIARYLLINRIQDNLSKMVRIPSWTNRTTPAWAFNRKDNS